MLVQMPNQQRWGDGASASIVAHRCCGGLRDGYTPRTGEEQRRRNSSGLSSGGPTWAAARGVVLLPLCAQAVGANVSSTEEGALRAAEMCCGCR